MDGMEYDVVVIGAGAAGLMAAGIATAGGEKQVLLIEKMEKAGRKIRITGKGRCNLTNMHERADFLAKVRVNVDFFEPSFDDFSNTSAVRFFKKIGVPIEIERGERAFPKSGNAWDIADALVDWCEERGVETMYNSRVDEIMTLGDKVYGVKYTNKKGFQRNIVCANVIICTGGVSYPGTGSTGDGYRFAHDLGHGVEDVRPSLVSLESSFPGVRALEGLQLRNVGAKLFVDGEVVQEEFGEMEFTDRGLGGAVILRVSRRAVDALIEDREVKVSLDLKSALDRETLVERIGRELALLEPDAGMEQLLRKLMPRQLVSPIAKALEIPFQAKIDFFTADKISRLIDILKEFVLPVSDYRSFSEAIVTAGGVQVTDIDPLTLQSKLIRGLYFAGEVLDLDADTGGYNLQIAFSTGHLAGRLIDCQELVKTTLTAE